MTSGTTKVKEATAAIPREPANFYSGAKWDEAMLNVPGFSFFHGTNWGRTLVDAYDFTPVCLVREQSGAPGAFLPLMEVNSWLTGRRGICLPFTDECDAFGAHDPMIFKDLNALARDRRWKSWEIRGNHVRPDPAPAALKFWGHSLELAPRSEDVFRRLQGAARTSIRKAQGHNLATEFSTDIAAVRSFHVLLCKTRQRHGLPPQPFRFFESLQRNILAKGQGWVVLARHEGKPVAGAIFLHLGTSAVYKFAASDSTFRELQANNLVLWRAIEWYSNNGFTSVDFGRTSLSNDGLRRFKRSWGATERAIEYTKFDQGDGHYMTMKDQTNGWHTRFFRILPKSLSNLIGGVAYRHLA